MKRLERWARRSFSCLGALKVAESQSEERLDAFISLHDDWLDKARINRALAARICSLTKELKAANVSISAARDVIESQCEVIASQEYVLDGVRRMVATALTLVFIGVASLGIIAWGFALLRIQ